VGRTTNDGTPAAGIRDWHDNLPTPIVATAERTDPEFVGSQDRVAFTLMIFGVLSGR
jgi:hypothetical protein